MDERVAHFLQCQAGGGELGRIDLDTNRGMLLAEDDDLGDTVHLRDLLGDEIIGVIVDGDERQRVRSCRKDHDRKIGRVYLLVARRNGHLLGQRSAGDSDRRLHVLARRVDVPVELELNRDRGGVQRTNRSQLRDPGDLAELPFERGGNRCRHRLGAGALKRRVHRNGREVDLRQRCHRQKRHRDQSDESDRRHQERSGDRSPNERFGNIHRKGHHSCCRARAIGLEVDLDLAPKRNGRRYRRHLFAIPFKKLSEQLK